MGALRNRIYIGSLEEPDFFFDNELIESSPVHQAVALVGQELSIDTFTPIVRESDVNALNAILFRSSDGKVIRLSNGQLYALEVTERAEPSPIIDIPDGTPAWYYHENELVGKFYLETVKRVGKTRYQLNCVSAIGRLDKMDHGGGLFLQATFGDVLRHILASGMHGDGDPVMHYEVDEDVAELPVSGWLPKATKRMNLYRLMLAYGINIVKGADGDPHFTFVHAAGAPEDIDSDALYLGGNVEYTKPYAAVSVLEHTYTALTDAAAVTLYDNTKDLEPITGKEVWFDQAPVIIETLSASAGLTILSATENGAILSGQGVLTGVPYTHSTQTVERLNAGGERGKTVSVNDCTMVSAINSENLLNRLFAFYCPERSIKKITSDLVFSRQRCGKVYRFRNPFGEMETAVLASAELNASSFVRGACEFYAGYDPVGQAGLYQNCIILDKATFAEDGGTFVVPQEILEMEEPSMRVVMIGGGQGGDGGGAGASGGTATAYTYVSKGEDISGMWYGAEGGAGGAGGNGGAPGRVKAVTINNPSASYNYTIGIGGEGGPASTTGANGSASTFDTYSSADEEGSYIPVAGVYNPIYGEFYALKGRTGIAGGQGGAWKGSGDGNFVWHTDGCNVMVGGTEYKGGRTGRPLTSIDGLPECKMIAYGGNGAGAAVGVDRADHPEMNGNSDQTAYWEVVEDGV